MRHLALPVAILLALTACEPLPQEAPYPGSPGPVDLTSCGGDAIVPLIGQNVAAMPDAGGWGTLRVIWPGMAVTEDYSVTRLNVEVDAEGRIIALSCG